MKYTKELQMPQLKELIYLECVRRSIGLAQEDELLDNIMEGAADMIIMSNGRPTDIREVLDWINEWIEETLKNYPRYFTTGEI